MIWNIKNKNQFSPFSQYML